MSELSSNEIRFSVEGHLFSFKINELCEVSEYFLAMLNGNFCESTKKTIVLEDVDCKLFGIFHQWMNTTSKTVTVSLTGLDVDNLLELIYLADRLFVHKLMHLCNCEVLKRLQVKPDYKDEFGEQRKQFYCKFFEVSVAIENLELKEFCVEWLVPKSFTICGNVAMERLQNTRSQIVNFRNVDKIEKICKSLSKPATAALQHILTAKTKELLVAIDQKIRIKKSRIMANTCDRMRRIRERIAEFEILRNDEFEWDD